MNYGVTDMRNSESEAPRGELRSYGVTHASKCVRADVRGHACVCT